MARRAQHCLVQREWGSGRGATVPLPKTFKIMIYIMVHLIEGYNVKTCILYFASAGQKC